MYADLALWLIKLYNDELQKFKRMLDFQVDKYFAEWRHCVDHAK